MDSNIKNRVINEIIRGFDHYMHSFRELTRKAPLHFRDRNWDGMQKTHIERLRLYKDRVGEVVGNCRENLKDAVTDRRLWSAIKSSYSLQIREKKDRELAESFFNSIIRKAKPGLSVDEELMFVYSDFTPPASDLVEDLFYHYSDNTPERIFEKILQDFDFGAPYFDRQGDIQNLAGKFDSLSFDSPLRIQVLKPVFYRNKAAYIIGRVEDAQQRRGFIIPFLHGDKGVLVDTLIFDTDIISGIFSFTRSYFMAEIDSPAQVVDFLNTLIPPKKIHELYNAIGFNKHGKTEFYRDFLNNLQNSQDQFVSASGIKGLVMEVFTLPSYNIVFKMIKDHFDPPKNMTRQQVREKYKLVSLHDRVGRMADTHEFEDFHLPLHRVHPSLLTALKNTVNSLIEIRGEELVLKHVYTERRMIPLNLYLETCSTEEAKQAVEEYGNAILQLAKANIFPGDMMTKNFGVTRQKRVVFYDYDEIEFLTKMNFRHKPKAETFEQIYASEPWYDIGPDDVFPEDFKKFMIGREDVKAYFFEYHRKLFDPEYWIMIQKRLKAGELIHAFPYPTAIRFRPLASF
ncbi:MAG TPA: bifunctional isocitrate dehydrogenase kinase/phosphatase [Cyclobacteriaceae bacterium]|nr:bifunctional isocitrate dehydrogenase kinase/phosphatase [Cyclobacteriaceae bacterium]